MGLLVCVLVPVVLLLFGVLDVSQTASAVLLLAGLWAIAYGLLFSKSGNKMYTIGIGIIVAVLSTLLFLPLQYVIGLVLIAVIAIVLATVVIGRNKA